MTTSTEFTNRSKKVVMRPNLFWSITWSWTVGMGVLFLGALFSWSTPLSLFEGLGINLSLGQTIITLQILWIGVSFKSLHVDEKGAVVAYGLPMMPLERGPKLIIAGIFQLEKFNGSVVNTQFPADPELIQKTDDSVPLETVEIQQQDGTMVRQTKVRPIRITTSGPKDSLDKNDILNSQMTVEFTFWVRWIITTPFAFIIQTGGDPEEVIKQMRDAGESLLNNRVVDLTPSELISGFSDLQKALQDSLKKSVELWGVEIVESGMTAPDLNHELASELRNIAKAKALAEQVIITSEGAKIKLINEGKGEAKAIEEKIAGEGRGFKRAAKFVGVEPHVLLEADVVRKTVGEADLVLGTDGLTQAVGLGRKLLENSNKSVDSNNSTEDTTQ